MERRWMPWLLILVVFAARTRSQTISLERTTGNRGGCGAVKGMVINERIVLDPAALNLAEGLGMQQMLDCLPAHSTVVIRMPNLRWENVLEIKKPVTLQGEGVSIQCPSEKSQSAMRIRSDNVTLSELSFADCELQNELGLIHVEKSNDVTLRGLHFESNVNRNGTSCISVENSTLHLRNITAKGNVGTHGGVVAAIDSSVVVLDQSEMDSNRDLDRGGAIYMLDAKMSISASRFVGNQARDAGGAIFVEGELGSEINLHDVEFIGGPVKGGTARNSTINARVGGAIALIGAKVKATIRNTKFISTSALIQGGSIFSQNTALLAISKTVFSQSSAGQGGSMLCADTLQNGRTVVKIKGSVFRENLARRGVMVEGREVNPVGGAARFMNLTNVSIVDSTFTDNNATYGGGLSAESCAKLTVKKSVFSKNRVTGEMGAGGAMGVTDVGILSIHNSEFSGNEAAGTFQEDLSSPAEVLSAGTNYLSKKVDGITSGGAIYLSGSLKNCSITATRFSENRAEAGGAIDLFEVIGGGVQISESVFARNDAVGQGGALTLERASTVVEIFDSSFTRNTAAFERGGGIAVQDTDLMIKNSIFDGNSVENGSGGAMHFAGSMNATIEGTSLISNSAAFGGAAFVEQNVDFLLRNSSFEVNTAKYGGGALFVRNRGGDTRLASEQDSRIEVVDSKFVGNEASWNQGGSSAAGIPGRGGGIMIEGQGVHIFLGNCTFSRNVAGVGGAGYLEQVTNTEVQSCDFTANAALIGGALSFRSSTWLHTFSFNCTESTFANNIAREGGAVSYAGIEIDSSTDRLPAPFTTNYAFFVKNSFVNNSASEGGGALDVVGRDIFFGLCLFVSNYAGSDPDLDRPGEGGAVRVRSAAFADFDGSSVINCTARSGGGIFVRNGVTRLKRSELSGNIGEENGGAIGTVLDQSKFGTVLLEDCVVENNQARKGGGLHLVTDRSSATDCGGAPRKSRPASREFMQLLEKCELHFSPNTTSGHFEHPYVLNNTRLKGNRAVEAAPEIFVSDPFNLKICCGEGCFTGSRLQDAPSCTSQYERGSSEVLPLRGGMDRAVTSPLIIEGYMSGKELQPIQVALLDTFGQSAFENVTLRMELATPHGDLSGNPVTENGILMSSKFTVKGVVLRALPGTYNISFDFTPNEEGGKFLTTYMNVVVRECLVGEVARDNGRRCEKCKPGFFSFDTADKNCELCPDSKATCSGSILTPQDGFWHSDTRSAAVHSCLLKDACTYDNRTEILQESSLRGRAINDLEEDYPQCTQGYEGVLCGSCASTHGKVRSLRCRQCGGKSSSGLMFGTVMLALLVISMIFVRSAGLHSKKVIGQANAALPSSGGSGCVLEIEGDDQSCLEKQGGEKLEKAEFSDMIKILVNFAQVTGAAAAINADWTESMLTVLSGLDAASGVGTSGFLAFDCAFSSNWFPRSIKTTIFLAFIPLIVWFAFALFYGWRGVAKKSSLHSFRLRCFVAALAVLQTSYLSLTRVLVRIFYCVSAKPLGSLFWAEDTSVVCYQGSHLLLVCLLGIPLLLVVSFGFPVGLFIKLTRGTAGLDDPNVVSRYGSFYKAYNENAVAWDVLILVRKALISVVVVFGRTLGEDVQGQVALFIIFVSVVLQMEFQPFKNPKLNSLELGSLCVSALTFVVGNIVNGESVTKTARSVLSVLFIAVVLVYLCYMAKQVYNLGETKLRAWVENNSGRSTTTMNSWMVMKTTIDCRLRILNNSVQNFMLSVRQGEREAQSWVAKKIDQNSVK